MDLSLNNILNLTQEEIDNSRIELKYLLYQWSFIYRQVVVFK